MVWPFQGEGRHATHHPSHGPILYQEELVRVMASSQTAAALRALATPVHGMQNQARTGSTVPRGLTTHYKANMWPCKTLLGLG